MFDFDGNKPAASPLARLPEAPATAPTEPPGAVAAISRRINTLSREEVAWDEAARHAPGGSPAEQEARERAGRLCDEWFDLRKKIPALRAETPADVAAQALVCFAWAERLGGDVSAAFLREGLTELRRMAASMAVAAAAIGRFDLARLGDVGDAAFCARLLAAPWLPAGEDDEGEPDSLDSAELVGLARDAVARARALAARVREVDGALAEGIPLMLLGNELAGLGRELLGEEGREMILSLARRDGLIP